jgi:diaminohydroxyphosphoribosylaminopyrimidine deaminase/5-amino-6-(5-phosphoribosylamino)uracil reductase
VTRLGEDVLLVARRARPATPALTNQPAPHAQTGRSSRHTEEEI